MDIPARLKTAQELIRNGQATCVLIRDGVIAGEASGIGVKPILHFLENEPGILKGAEVADKVIGKAAAMLLVFGGALYVYGELMSISGRDYLQKQSIPFSFGTLVDKISSRDGIGICPLEQSVMEIDDPKKGYDAIKTTIAKLMAG